jgi:hypothetical protein
MAVLSRPQLLKLIGWNPIAAGFGTDSDVYEARVSPIVRSAADLGRRVVLLGDRDLSNYAWIFVCDTREKGPDIFGLHLYLSILGPLASMGRGAAFLGTDATSASVIEPSAVLNPGERDDFENSLAQGVEAAGYRLLTRDEALEPLPSDVRPTEFCLNEEPWDRVFHLLFSNVD